MVFKASGCRWRCSLKNTGNYSAHVHQWYQTILSKSAALQCALNTVWAVWYKGMHNMKRCYTQTILVRLFVSFILFKIESSLYLFIYVFYKTDLALQENAERLNPFPSSSKSWNVWWTWASPAKTDVITGCWENAVHKKILALRPSLFNNNSETNIWLTDHKNEPKAACRRICSVALHI